MFEHGQLPVGRQVDQRCPLQYARLIAYVIVESGATDLQNGADVTIVDAEGIPIGGGAVPVHNHDGTYLRLDGTVPMLGSLDMGTHPILNVVDPTNPQDAATKNYVDTEIGALPPPFSGDHDDLTNVLPDQHHARYTDAEAIAAVGPHFSGDHDDLTNVTSDQHHAQVHDLGGTDHTSGAEAAGRIVEADGLGGVRWATPSSGVTDHALLTNVQPNQHHVRYTDAEAIAAVGDPGDGVYLPLAGGTLTGLLRANGGLRMLNAAIPDVTATARVVLWDTTTGEFQKMPTNYNGPWLPLTGGTLTGTVLMTADSSEALSFSRNGSGPWSLGSFSGADANFVIRENGVTSLTLFARGNVSNPTAGAILSVGTYYAGNGSEALPSLAWGTARSTGFYSTSATALRFASGGVEQLILASTATPNPRVRNIRYGTAAPPSTAADGEVYLRY